MIAKGLPSGDPSMNELGVYFFFAEAFRFTPKQVRGLSIPEVQGLMILKTEKSKQEEDELKKAARR